MIVVMPMAGRGSRFLNQGIETPKPLIQVKGKPMFYWALQSIKDLDCTVIFVALSEHEKNHALSTLISKHCNFTYHIVWIDEITEGQLCTVLKASQFFNGEEDVLIIPSDTLVISKINEEIKELPKNVHGLISTINLEGEQWSFAKVDENDCVIQVAEKVDTYLEYVNY